MGRGGGGSHQPIRRAARHQGAIQTEINTAHGVTMRRQAPHEPPRAHIPQEDSLVVAPARKYVALWAEGETIQVVVVPQQGFPPAAAPHARVAGTATDAPSAGADPPDGGGGVLVGAAGVGRVAGGPVPEADGLVVGAGGEGLAVGAPGEARHAGHVADKGVHVGARRGVPDHGGAVG